MPDRLVPHFQEELEQLKTRLLEMGGLAEDRVRSALDGLVERDSQLVDRVLGGDVPINQLHIEIDSRCFKLLALAPADGGGSRAIVSAVKINTDLERVGDLAINIAEAVRRYMRHPPVKELIDIPRMAEIAQSMLRDSLDSYVRRDIALAQSVLNQDDELDALKTQVFRDLLTLHAAGSQHDRARARSHSDLPPPGAHRRPRDEHRRGRHLHGVRQGRPSSRRRSGGELGKLPALSSPASLLSARRARDRRRPFGARFARACSAGDGLLSARFRLAPALLAPGFRLDTMVRICRGPRPCVRTAVAFR